MISVKLSSKSAQGFVGEDALVLLLTDSDVFTGCQFTGSAQDVWMAGRNQLARLFVNAGDKSLALNAGMYTSSTGAHIQARRQTQQLLLCHERKTDALFGRCSYVFICQSFLLSLIPQTQPSLSQRPSFQRLQMKTHHMMKTAIAVCLQNSWQTKSLLWACCLCCLRQRHQLEVAAHLLQR